MYLLLELATGNPTRTDCVFQCCRGKKKTKGRELAELKVCGRFRRRAFRMMALLLVRADVFIFPTRAAPSLHGTDPTHSLLFYVLELQRWQESVCGESGGRRRERANMRGSCMVRADGRMEGWMERKWADEVRGADRHRA